VNHSVPIAKARSGKEIDALALNLVKAFQPEVLRKVMAFDVERFFDCELKTQTGVEPVYRPLGERLLGYTSIIDMECVICSKLVDEAKDDVDRRVLRATQAHEIGHCHLHVEEFRRNRDFSRFQHDDQQAFLQLHNQEEIKVYRNPEWQAWRFAGALLMPECTIRLAVSNNWSIKMMSWGFDVNPAFVKVRLDDLKIPTDVKGR